MMIWRRDLLWCPSGSGVWCQCDAEVAAIRISNILRSLKDITYTRIGQEPSVASGARRRVQRHTSRECCQPVRVAMRLPNERMPPRFCHLGYALGSDDEMIPRDNDVTTTTWECLIGRSNGNQDISAPREHGMVLSPNLICFDGRVGVFVVSQRSPCRLQGKFGEKSEHASTIPWIHHGS